MINLYTNFNKIPRGLKLTTHIDSYFFMHITSKDLTTLQKSFLLKIDNAKLVEGSTKELIETPEGYTFLDNLSAGCKTLIFTEYIIIKGLQDEYCLFLNACGENALKLFIQTYKDTNLNVYLTYYPSIVNDLGDIAVKHNGTTTLSFRECCDLIYRGDDTDD